MVSEKMDAAETRSNSEVKDIPPAPIKTYQWEDVRRAREKGDYPYTHLFKEPYDEEVDPEEFTMEAFRRSKSASTLGKSESGVVIREITDDTKSVSKDYLDVGGMYKSEGIVESADSSAEDNISQYLDKDGDDRPEITEQIEAPGPSTKEESSMEKENGQDKMDVDEAKAEGRAKSEEPKRKRKLSIESSYSRMSLSRLGVMKKLREAKEKIKLPKFSFSKSDSKLGSVKKPVKPSETEKAKEPKKIKVEPKKIEGPLYIHIPLKPPPGETDEFSYLEFEEARNDTAKKSAPTTPAADITSDEEVEPKEEKRNDVQFIILTAPSDDEILDDHVMIPDTPSSDDKKFFDNTKIRELRSLAKDVVDEISPDTKIDGIIFEDVIQVEYVDENNRPLATTENSKFIEVTEETLPKLERQLSKRNLRSLQNEIRASRESLNKLVRQREKEKLKEASKLADKSRESTPVSVGQMPEIKSFKEEVARQEASSGEEIRQSEDDATNETAKDDQENRVDLAEAKQETALKDGDRQPKPAPSVGQKILQEPERKVMVDEEDGLKLSDEAVRLINEELAKEKLSEPDEEPPKFTIKPASSLKKKVSFKRRSKQEDPDGIYEDVQVTSDKTKDAAGNREAGKELKVLDASQSMSVDEEKTYLDDKIMKTTSLEEDYNKWSKLPDHEYEPVNPPDDGKQQAVPEVHVTSANAASDINKPVDKFEGRSVRIPLHEDDVVVAQSEDDTSGDALTAEEMQARIEDRFFNVSALSPKPEVAATAPTVAVTKTDEGKEEPVEKQGGKFQAALKNQAEKIRARIRNMTGPSVSLPQRPKFHNFKIETPKINMPKIPDQVRVTLPSFTLPKRGGAAAVKKRSLKERQLSTESNAGDSKKKFFDFSTYPRIFSRKKKGGDDFDEDAPPPPPAPPQASTVPRTKELILGSRWGQRLVDKRKTEEARKPNKETEPKKKKSPDVIRIPLHSEESMDREASDEEVASHNRYNEDIDMDDAYLRENQEIHRASPFSSDFSRNRWNHGSFHGENLHEIAHKDKVTDLDVDLEAPSPQRTPSPQPTKLDVRSTSSTGDVHRRGVLEEIDADEFFLRQKGISQDDIEMEAYISKEIRDAFRKPVNTLSQLQAADDDFDQEVSDRSLQEPPKRKPVKKPKRKKTPHVSQEKIRYDQESEPEEYRKTYDAQPPRPKRKSKKKKGDDTTVPYQETIPIREGVADKPNRESVSDEVLNDRCEDDRRFYDGDEYPGMYENEHMLGIEQPNILVSDPYQRQMFKYADDDDDLRYINDQPETPPRKQKSLRSLPSDHDSISDEIKYANQGAGVPQANVEAYRMEHEYIIPTPPVKPVRTRSRTRSQSRTTQGDDDLISRSGESQNSEQPCVEEPCVQQVCDYMGYAIIDKSKQREPPLPPPPRRKRSVNSAKSETKFFTVPRPLKDEVPVRPLRNYSTLAPKTKIPATNITDEEKENISLSQYIEIEDDEHSRDLQSGDVIQKMKDRPLPAPPRPPRKHKDPDKSPFKDVTHRENIKEEEEELIKQTKLEESEASVQTEPLPDDFVCEDFVQDKNDKVITPSSGKIQPVTDFEHVETVTHGALVVAPLPATYQEGPLTSFSRSTERIITVKREVGGQKEVDGDEETSDVPEGFTKLKDPPSRVTERIIERQPEVEVLKAQKLQVSDLDVDRLTVNELLAGTIRVSEIDSSNIAVSEINPRSGNIVLGGVELPASFLRDLVQKLQCAPEEARQSPTPQKADEEEDLKGTVLGATETQEKQPEKMGGSATETEDTCERPLPAEDALLKEIEDQVVTANVSSLADDFFTTEVDASTSRLVEGEPSKREEDVPKTTEDTMVGEEDRLIEELKQVSDEQKKTSFEDDFDLVEPPQRPPRLSDYQRQYQLIDEVVYAREYTESSEASRRSDEQEEVPPPRPPQPTDALETVYLRSQPPPSFYTLRSPVFDNIIDDIPSPPRRRRQQKTLSRSSSDEAPPTPRGRRQRTPEASIPQLAGQLTRACATAGDRALRRLIKHITTCVLQNADGRQDLHVVVVILLVLIAGLILLGWGDGKTVHHHHWEYFNPPTDM